MKIGSKVKFDYINGKGDIVSTTLFLSNNYLNENKMSDESVKGKLSLELQKKDLFTLKQYGYIFAARCLLMKDIDATDIDIEEVKEQGKDPGKAMFFLAILIILAVIIAVIILPIFIILGMHGKLFLRNLYSKCQNSKHKKFVNIFTILGITVYTLALLAFILGKVIPNAFLSSSVFNILFFGGLIYSVLSLIIMKKKMFEKDEKLNIIQNIKSGFKKTDNKETPKQDNLKNEDKKVKKEKNKESKNEAAFPNAPITISSEPQLVNENLASEVKEDKTNGIQKHLESHNSYYKYLQEEITKEEKNLSEAENEYIKANIQRRLNNYKEELKSVLSDKKVNDYIQYLQEEIAKEEHNLSSEKNEYIRIAINNRLAEYKEELEKTLVEACKIELIHEEQPIANEQPQFAEPTIGEIKPIVLEEQSQVVEELEVSIEESVKDISNKKLKKEKNKKEKLDKPKKHKKKFKVVLVIFIFILLLILGMAGYFGIYKGLFFNQSIENPGPSTELQNGDTIVKDSITYRLDINGEEKGFTLIGVNINEIDEKVVIPSSINGISVIAISKDVFKECNNLRSITIPFVGETKEGIENTHFGYIFGATTYSDNNKFVPESLKEVIISDGTNIGKFAFNECSSLESVTIPESINSIEAYTFSKCTNLIEIKFKENSKLTNIGMGAFSNCSSLTSITLPNGVISIGESAFRGCAKLKSIIIPNSVNNIEKHAFKECTSLVEVIFEEGSQLENIVFETFCKCESLESIVIPNSIIGIGESAFEKCNNLKNITLPNGVISIGESAFRGCAKLKSIIIPNSVNNIEKHAFKECTSLVEVIFEEGSQLKSICDYAFYDCTSLNSIVIPDGVISIGNTVFHNCSNLDIIIIPNSVTIMGKHVFIGCSKTLKIVCNVDKAPSGWDEDWNIKNNNVIWGYNN